MTASLLRASIPKSSWAEIALLDPPRLAKIEEIVGRPFVAELTAASGVAWIAFEFEAKLADATYEVLGASETRALYRRKTVRSFDIPLIRPILQSSLRVFGATPASILKMVGRTWALASRNCGSYACVDESDQRRSTSIVRDFPTRLYRRREAWLETAMGGYEGFFAPFRLDGTVRVTDRDFAAGSASFLLEW
jgi:hypothetical protein